MADSFELSRDTQRPLLFKANRLNCPKFQHYDHQSEGLIGYNHTVRRV